MLDVLAESVQKDSEIEKAIEHELETNDYYKSNGVKLEETLREYFYTKGNKKNLGLDSAGFNYGVIYNEILVKLGYKPEGEHAWRIFRGYNQHTKEYYYEIYYTMYDISQLQKDALIPARVYRLPEKNGFTRSYTRDALAVEQNVDTKKIITIGGLDRATWIDFNNN